jgi:DNA-binding response OmpR family regulator
MSTIVIIDDEMALRTIVRAVLERDGHTVVEAVDGRDGLRAVHEAAPDVVLLDIAMPELDGWQTLERLRDFTDTPVMMLTARASEDEKVRALRGGADDYMTKPFGNAELLARVALLASRPRATGAADLPPPRTHGALEVDPVRRQVRVGGQAIDLTRIEFDLLDVLSASPRRSFTRRELIDQVWGPAWFGDEHLVDAHISKMRRKLGDSARAPRFVETVRGVGFRMADPPE